MLFAFIFHHALHRIAIFRLLQIVRGYFVCSTHWRQQYHTVQPLLKVIVIGRHGCQHLGCSLAMTNIRHSLYLGFFNDIVKKCWLIIVSHFLKTEVPKFLMHIRIQTLMLPTIPIATCVIHPNVKASICEKESHRFQPITAHTTTIVC